MSDKFATRTSKAGSAKKSSQEVSASLLDAPIQAKGVQHNQIFLDLGQQLNSARVAKEAARIISKAAEKLLGWDACSFDLYSPELGVVTPVLNIDLVEKDKREVPAAYEGKPPSQRIRQVIDAGGQLILREPPILASEDMAAFGDVSRPSASLMIVPVRNNDRVIGVLSIQSYSVHAYDREALQTLQALADYCGGALERIRAEELLRASEERYRTIVETAAEGLWMIDADARTTFANRSMEKMLGYEAGEMLGRSLFDFIPAEDRELFEKRIEMRRQGVHEQHESRYVRRDGTILWGIVATSPFQNPDGKFLGAMAMFTDISERKRAEERLHFLSEASAILSSSLDYKTTLQTLAKLIVPKIADWCAIDIVNSDGKIERVAVVHPDAEKIKLALEIHQRWPDGPEDAIPRVIKSGQSIVASEIPEEGVRAASKSPEHFKMLCTLGLKSCLIVPLQTRNKIFGAISFINAESNQRFTPADLGFAENLVRRAALAIDNAQLFLLAETERSVAFENESYFRNLAEAIPHMVWTCKADGGFEYCNRRWREYTKQSFEESQWPGWLDAVDPEHRTRVAQTWERAMKVGELFECEYLLRRGSDGAFRWHIDRAVPLRDVQGRIIKWFGTCTDIHDSKVAEEMGRKINQELERRVDERTNALKEINDQMESFCYSISHDLRAPLRAMRSFTQVLLEEYAPQLDKTGQDFLQRVGSSAERMDKLILDLLEYSRLGRMELTLSPVPIDKVLESVLLDLRFESKEKKANIEVVKPLPVVLGNETILKQVFFNLISNALKFISWDVTPQIKIFAAATSDPSNIRIWIEDNGIGIAKEHHERVFRVFERLHGVTSYPGTGIGLAIVQKGIERLRGTVGVDSRLGKGSRFWLELPKHGDE
ncbi:MAG: Sensor protein [Verrucomicrobiales bacterium]|nr:Sensor protein [Verrucomicrobiales bacterium]